MNNFDLDPTDIEKNITFKGNEDDNETSYLLQREGGADEDQ